MLNWSREGGASKLWVHVLSAICEAYLVYLCCIDLFWIGIGGGVSMSLVYLHSSICQTYSM